ncbi:MAG: guanylate kinase [Verrucomicrobiota bacterium]
MSGRLGVLLLVSGPSGSGKTSLCQALRDAGEVVYSISCTTRRRREGELDGEHYHFLSEEDFERRVSAGDFLEHAVVHGNRYGTLKGSVLERLESGTDVAMDIDVQGAALVRGCEDAVIQRVLVDVFVMPPSMEELEKRLSGRGTESAGEMEVRLANAAAEMAHAEEYGHRIVSGTREEDYERLLGVLEEARVG